MKTLNVGLIGYGFMGRAHSNGYRQVNNFFDVPFRPVLKAACGRKEADVKAFAEQWGYESTVTDWKQLVARDDIELVEICVPNNLHAAWTIRALKAGKHVLCEKPLASNAAEAREMAQTADAQNRCLMEAFHWRYHPGSASISVLVGIGPNTRRVEGPRGKRPPPPEIVKMDDQGQVF